MYDHALATPQILRMDAYCQALLAADDLRGFYSDPTNCGSLLDALREIVEEKQIKAISWDVFDTALLRHGRSEASRFQALAEGFVERCRAAGNDIRFSADDAFLARLTAARAAYSMSPTLAGNREGRFGDIARLACELLGEPGLNEIYIANELACELAATTPNPLLTLVKEALPKLRVVFLSDMYLEAERIGHLLGEHFGALAAGSVHSSADGHGSKRAGTLFAHAAKALRLPGEKILHIGDNLLTDYQMPKRCGWNAFYLPLPDSEKRRRRECHDALRHRLEESGIRLGDYLQFNL